MTMIDRHLDVDQLSAAVDGDQDAVVSAHLLACRACRAQLSAWQGALDGIRHLDQDPAPPPDDAISAAMVSWTPPSLPAPPRSPRRRRTARAWRPVAAVAAVVLVAGGVYGLSRAAEDSSSTATSSGASSSGTVASPSHQGSAGSGGPATRAAPPIAVTGKTALAAQLRRIVAAPRTSVAASTPCYHPAQTLAASRHIGGAVPAYETSIDYRGVLSRAYVYASDGGYVAVVVRSASCTLVVTVSF